LNRWSLQPSAAFLQEQETLVFGQTLTYVALTALALLALLVAMWLLARAAKRDMALAQLKSNFVADVSHELKTPLAVIRLYAETLQSGRPLDETKRMEYYTVIERESTRLTNLIDNILDFARIEAGRQAYRFRPTDIAAVVRERYDAYRGQLDHQGFIHRLSIAESLPPVHADPEAIGQALLNLISNAVKYSADEKFLAVKVTADTRRDRQGVVISVEDHGIGISAADRARVFEGFFRADDGRVHLRGGTGLGLALVKNIVDAHGGVLSVESRLVKGTAFRLFLPAGRQGGAEQIAGSPDEAENVEPAGE
jgi:signal transduction histidine kinase